MVERAVDGVAHWAEVLGVVEPWPKRTRPPRDGAAGSGELDTNVDPSSTMQAVNALIKANKTFDLLVVPGEDHGAGRRGITAAYGEHKRWDYFVWAMATVDRAQSTC